jgi:prepilin-type N-terminal cleavage/methylation domain-containing protein
MFKVIHHCCRGYTFIELLIALAVLALVITPLLTLYSSSALMIGSSADYSAAVNLCRAKIEHLKALNPDDLKSIYLAGGVILENDLPGYPSFERLTTLTPFQPADYYTTPEKEQAENILLSIAVTVRWFERGSERSETVWTLLWLR